MKFAGLFVVLLLLFIASVPVWNSAVGAAVTTAAQDPSAVEASLGLDRPARRLIQQGLRTEGFDPGAPDGLFGPRTRTAIREWQEARGVPPTGYLDSVDVDLLRAAASLSGSSSPMPATATDTNVSPLITERPASLAEIPVPAPATTPVGHPPATSTRGNPQLPPAILVDRHLVRVERLLAADDYEAAHDEMLEIIALQKLHALVLPDDFQFEYARVAFRTGLTEVAIASLNEYLVAAGRGGAFYREALNLLDSAEETLRRVAAERRRIDAERRRIDAERRRVAPLQRAHNAMVQRQLEAAAVSIPRDTLKSGGVGPELVMMAPARFQYFAYDISDADHLHWVDIARPFAISKYEVTRAAFGRFVSRTRYQTDADRDPGYGCDGGYGYRQDTSLRWNRPGFAQTDNHPVTCVSIWDAMAYTEWLSRETDHSYRLPSATDWQYALRAGSTDSMLPPKTAQGVTPDPPLGYYSVDVTGMSTCRYGNVGGCSDGERHTVAVGQSLPNDVGLYDMYGNVAELVLACAHVIYKSGTFEMTGPSLHGSLEYPTSCGDDGHVIALGNHWGALRPFAPLQSLGQAAPQ